MKKQIFLALALCIIYSSFGRIIDGKAQRYWFLSPNANGWLLFVLDPITGRQQALDQAFETNNADAFEEFFNPNDIYNKKDLIARAIRNNRLRIFQIIANQPEGKDGQHLDVSKEYADYLNKKSNPSEAFSVLHDLVEIHGTDALAMLQEIEKQGISIIAQNEEGQTILHTIAGHDFKIGEIANPAHLAAFLGFLQDRLNGIADAHGKTALHEAIYKKNDLTIIGLLLNHPTSSIDMPDNSGITVEDHVRNMRKEACNPDISRLEEQCYECNYWTALQRLMMERSDADYAQKWLAALERKREDEERKKQELEAKLTEEQATIAQEVEALERLAQEKKETLAKHEQEAEETKRRQEEHLKTLEFLNKQRNDNN